MQLRYDYSTIYPVVITNGFYKVLIIMETKIIEFKEAKFSEREIEVIVKFSQGYNAEEVGELLHISHFTVLSHKKKIYKKLGIKKTIHLGVYAERRGLLKDIPLFL